MWDHTASPCNRGWPKHGDRRVHGRTEENAKADGTGRKSGEKSVIGDVIIMRPHLGSKTLRYTCLSVRLSTFASACNSRTARSSI